MDTAPPTTPDEIDAPLAGDSESPVDATPEFFLRVSDDKISVLLDCPAPHGDLDDLVSGILRGFVELELPEYPDAAFLAEILTCAGAPDEPLVATPLIMGQAPVPARDGRLEWTRDFFTTGWEADETTGAVDFWAKLDHRSVTAGECLLHVRPAIPGESGLNVFSNKIPVDKPERARMRAGKGVEAHEDDAGVVEFTAAINGRIRCQDGILSVDELYVIKGNVSLETGNISHTGALQIEGDVELGARVEAQGDVVVKGMLEACHLTCGGSLFVSGGIVGDEDLRISVKGRVQAKYIRDAVLSADGDVVVANEITHSQVETCGQVQIPQGRIVGGRTIARQGITVGEAGAGGSASTLLVAGLDPILARQTQRIQDDLRRMGQTREKLERTLKRTSTSTDASDDDASDTPENLANRMHTLDQALIDGEQKLRRLSASAAAGAREEIVILRELWSGTTLQLGEYQTLAKVSVHKPRLVRRARNKVRILPLGDGNMPES